MSPSTTSFVLSDIFSWKSVTLSIGGLCNSVLFNINGPSDRENIDCGLLGHNTMWGHGYTIPM